MKGKMLIILQIGNIKEKSLTIRHLLMFSIYKLVNYPYGGIFSL